MIVQRMCSLFQYKQTKLICYSEETAGERGETNIREKDTHYKCWRARVGPF